MGRAIQAHAGNKEKEKAKERGVMEGGSIGLGEEGK